MNWVRAGRAVFLSTLAVTTASCGNNPVSPTPTAPYLFTSQFSGSWAGTAALTSITPVVKGECLEPSLQSQLGLPTTGVEQVNLALSQDATSVTGRLASGSTGLACTYKGTSSGNTMALDSANCDDAPILLLRCTNDAVRDMELVGSTVQAKVDNGQLRGTVAYTYNIRIDPTDIGVNRVVLQYNLTAGRP